MRVLVCGGRSYRNEAHVRKVLTALYKHRSISRVITGGATGADALAADWCRAVGVDLEVYRADWAQHGKAAGPLRNQQMLDAEKPDLVVAFPGGRGTDDMIWRAQKAGVHVIQARFPEQAASIHLPASGVPESTRP